MTAPDATFHATNCTGRIRHGDDEASITFEVLCDSLGKIRIQPQPLALTNENNFLRLLWHENRLTISTFTVEGTSDEGWSIRSTTAWFEELRTPSTPTSVKLEMRIACQVLEAVAPEPPPEDPQHRLLEYTIAGLRTFREQNAEFDFGAVSIEGSHESNNEGHFSGTVLVTPNTNQETSTIDQGVERVLTVLSFANGRGLPWGIRREAEAGRPMSVTFVSHSPPGPGRWAPFHFMNLQPLIAHAATHYTGEVHAASGLGIATQWRLAPSPLVEIRIIQGMTALEHLLHCDETGHGTRVPKAEFRRVRRELKAVIDRQSPESTHSGEVVNWDALGESLGNLNQRPLKDNLVAYLDRHRVPLDGLEQWIPGEIIRLRNDLVHRGLDQGDRSLLSYDAALHELHTRIFLARISYEGDYTSWLDGQRDETFTLRSTAAPLE